MLVTKVLKSKEYTLEQLESELGIISKHYPEEGLIVLNYDQINSPKTNPIVMECRGLIVDTEFNVVSRSFDRFFNLGEAPDTQKHLDFSKALCYHKTDGSLIKIYNYNNKWHISTRGTAFAESCVNKLKNMSFKDLVLRALNISNDEEFQALCNENLNPRNTYINEVTSRENRVVTPYEGYTLWHLAIRDNETGEYIDSQSHLSKMGITGTPAFLFTDSKDIVESANGLSDLMEGYVVYQDLKPVCKVKSNLYLVVHKLRGNQALTKDSLIELVVENEHEEYIAYFPEDADYFTPYVESWNTLCEQAVIEYERYKNIEGQKDFALAIKHLSFASVLFSARRTNDSIKNVIRELTTLQKFKLLDTYHESRK